jgi:protein involved in polysaccharide export with SLBB domain
MRLGTSRWVRVAVAVAVLGPASARLAAQAVAIEASRAEATREDLERLLAGMSSAQQESPVAAMIRERLNEGDLKVGDRVVLQIKGENRPVDSLIVSPARTITVQDIPEISVRGVLRSELGPYLTEQLSKYFRSPDIQAKALIRIAVLGEVAKPGFYDFPAEALISGVFTTAGGLTGGSDVSKTEIRRGTVVIWQKEAVREAIAKGVTLDQLNFQSGDEINVGAKKAGGAEATLRVIGLIVALPLSIFALTQVIKK